VTKSDAQIKRLQKGNAADRRAAAGEILDFTGRYPNMRRFADSVLRGALRDRDRMVRTYAGATLLIRNGHTELDVEFVREAAESLDPMIRELAEEAIAKAVENIRSSAAVKAALADIFVQFLWDLDMQTKAARALAWTTTGCTDLSPRVVYRLKDLLRDPKAGPNAAAALANLGAQKGNFSEMAALYAESLRLDYTYSSPKAAAIAEDALLEAADRGLDISAAVPSLEAAYASGNSGDNAGWALVRHYSKQGRREDLRRLVPIRVNDSYLHVTVTISDKARKGKKGKPVERFQNLRCGYCGNPETLVIYYKAGNDSWGEPWTYEVQCSECGKFTLYVKDPG
jgi:hypothetical protein